jgi:hypothetical protein
MMIIAFRTDEEREDITQRATNAGAGAVDCQYKDHYSWTSTPCFLDGDGDMPTGFMTTVATLRARLNRGREFNFFFVILHKSLCISVFEIFFLFFLY